MQGTFASEVKLVQVAVQVDLRLGSSGSGRSGQRQSRRTPSEAGSLRDAASARPGEGDGEQATPLPSLAPLP